MNNKLERLWKEVVVARCKEIPKNFLGTIEKNQKGT
jgi:hypothetical protein